MFYFTVIAPLYGMAQGDIL